MPEQLHLLFICALRCDHLPFCMSVQFEGIPKDEQHTHTLQFPYQMPEAHIPKLNIIYLAISAKTRVVNACSKPCKPDNKSWVHIWIKVLFNRPQLLSLPYWDKMHRIAFSANSLDLWPFCGCSLLFPIDLGRVNEVLVQSTLTHKVLIWR